MLSKLKTVARDLVPTSAQVPLKYWCARVSGGLEPEMALLPRLVRAGDHVVDVGGNRGVYLYALTKLGTRVDVFEPNPGCHRTLASWAGSRPGITVHRAALSAEPGEATLFVPVGADGVEHDASGSLEHGAVGNARGISVPLATLDPFGFRDTALIKIDVEGHEESAVRGAVATIAANRPALLIEIEQRHIYRPIQEVFDLVLGTDYAGYYLSGDRLLPLSKFRLERDQRVDALGSRPGYHNNFLFLAKERVARGDHARVLTAFAT